MGTGNAIWLKATFGLATITEKLHREFLMAIRNTTDPTAFTRANAALTAHGDYVESVQAYLTQHGDQSPSALDYRLSLRTHPAPFDFLIGAEWEMDFYNRYAEVKPPYAEWVRWGRLMDGLTCDKWQAVKESPKMLMELATDWQSLLKKCYAYPLPTTPLYTVRMYSYSIGEEDYDFDGLRANDKKPSPDEEQRLLVEYVNQNVPSWLAIQTWVNTVFELSPTAVIWLDGAHGL